MILRLAVLAGVCWACFGETHQVNPKSFYNSFHHRHTVLARIKPGDVVAWDLGGGVTHIGLVSDQQSPDGTLLVIHNIGQGVKEEDILFRHQMIGHYRPKLLRGRPAEPHSN